MIRTTTLPCIQCGALHETYAPADAAICSDDCWEAWLDLAETERYAAMPAVTDEQRRRVFALCAYRCPDHGCDLEECEDVDEHGVHVYYRCPTGDHVFGSIHDEVGGYAPMDDEIRALAIEPGVSA